MQVKFKKLNPNAVIPTKATAGAAAYDLYLPEPVCIEPGRQVLKLGFAMQLPEGHCAVIVGRSGNTVKGVEGFSANTVGFTIENNTIKAGSITLKRHDADVELGIVDADYRGEVGVLFNNRDAAFIHTAKNAIAQMLIIKAEDVAFAEVEHLDKTDRADGGYGHTDK